MLHRTSLMCSSTAFSSSLHNNLPSYHHHPPTSLQYHLHLLPPSHSIHFPFTFPPTSPRLFTFPPLHTTATDEIRETNDTGSEYVDIGYVSSVHGLQGEIRVKPNTDFPEMRFSQPGRRWLKQNVSGGEIIQEVELEEGREHPGQKSWILKFRDIDSVEQARVLIGSTLLVTKDDRPELEDGEFYTNDLVGMKVFMKESGEPLGIVVNVFNSGANDLLHVLLDSSFGTLDKSGKPRSTEAEAEAEAEASNQLIWVPFVEAIVPDVDMMSREMHITPPKGLLELNLRTDERSKKERRQLEWKERKKFQKRLIAAKKKLIEMEQQHVFHGFKHGEKEQGRLLADHIVSVNSKLLQNALQHIGKPPKRWEVAELVDGLEAKLVITESREKSSKNIAMHEKGLRLISEGKMAIVLLLNDKENWECTCNSITTSNEATEISSVPLLHKLLSDENFVKEEDRASVPLILVCSADEIVSLRKLFSTNNYFAFDSNKVWFLEEEKLPVVSSLSEGQSKHKLLMKSPWEILQSPVGSGGVISLFSSHGIADNLSNMGVEYMEICCPSKRNVGGNSLFLGYVNSREADIGIRISPTGRADSDENIDMILSMDFMKELMKKMNKLQFNVTPKANAFVEKVDKDWVTVTSSTPNSYEFYCSIYSSLDVCSLDKVCVMEVRE